MAKITQSIISTKALAFCLFLYGLLSGMNAQGQYCIPEHSYPCGNTTIDNFTTTNGVLNISNTGPNCGTLGYSFIQNQTVAQYIGSSFDFSFTANGIQGNKIWVDWNQDQDFLDPGEEVWASTGLVFNNRTGSITIPLGTASDVYRMRIRATRYAFPSGPCLVQDYNETEDYLISVLSPSANDVKLEDLTLPVSVFCSPFGSVSVDFRSLGSTNLTSTSIGWSINGLTQASSSWLGNLSPGMKANNLVLTNGVNFNEGDVIKAWVFNPNSGVDANPQNDTLSLIVPPSGLSGNYTINKLLPTSGSNFNSFSDAINKLTLAGVCGDVTFTAAVANYTNELIEIHEIRGAGPNATITFKGISENQQAFVRPVNSIITNHIVLLDGADYIRFEHIRFLAPTAQINGVIVLKGQTDDIRITDCILETTYNSASCINGSDYVSGDIKIEGCTIQRGNVGVHFPSGLVAGNNTSIEINDCLIKDFYTAGVILSNGSVLKVKGNVIETNSGSTNSSYGIGINGLGGLVEIEGNRINPNTSPFGNPSGLIAPTIGIRVHQAHLSNGLVYITNNSISQINSGSAGSLYNRSFSGINIVSATSGSQFKVFHNSVFQSGGTSSSKALDIEASTCSIQNNNLLQLGPGSAIGMSSGSSKFSDNNNLYAPNSRVGASFSHVSLADWQNATNFDSNSISIDPQFTDATTGDLTTCAPGLIGVGASLAGVVDQDYFGQARNPLAPDLGAFEIVSPSEFAFNNDTVWICPGDSILLQGATGNISNAWSTGSTDTSILVTGAGVITLTMTGVCGSFTDTVVVVSDTIIPAISLNSVISCNAASDGELVASATGGAAPYTFQWSNGANTALVTGLVAGTYSVTVSDANGCAGASQFVLTEPAAIVSTLTQTGSLICGGTNNVDLVSAVSGGVTPYSYQWSTGGNTSSIAVSLAGVYTVTVSDANGCTGATQTSVQCTAVSIAPAFCGSTLNSLGDYIYHSFVPGATNYRYQIASGSFSTVHVRGYAATSFQLGAVAGIQYNTSYSVSVAALVNGLWTLYGPACTITTPAVTPTTSLVTNSCNITLNNLAQWLYIGSVSGATNYRYRVSAGAFSQVYTRGYHWTNFRLAFVSGIAYNTTYTVEVAAEVGGVWGPYGAACQLTTPSVVPATQLVSSQCNTTLSSWTQYLFYQTVSGADNYRVEITNSAAGFNTVYVRGYQWTTWRIDWASNNLQPNTTYDIRVAASVNGTWGSYGPVCTLTTPGVPQARLAVATAQEPGQLEEEVQHQELFLSVYPNPARNEVNLQGDWEAGQAMELLMYDLNGKLVMRQALIAKGSESPILISTTSLSSGLYLIQIQSGGQAHSARVVIDR